MLVLPGGAYEMHADHEAEPVARWLNGLGLHAVVLRYRMSPHRHPAPLEDAVAALRSLRAGDLGLAVDRERVGVIGFSAGGHLAASLSNADADGGVPDFAILGYPVISFVHEVNEPSARNLLGEPSLQLRRDHSLEYRVSSRTPPTFLWHTADDDAVPLSNSLRYADALARNGVPVELHVFPHGRHGLSILDEVPHVTQWMELCARWLTETGVLDPGETSERADDPRGGRQ
ncbi:alpha/beta hydrolase [Microlunatus panaciterrae]